MRSLYFLCLLLLTTASSVVAQKDIRDYRRARKENVPIVDRYNPWLQTFRFTAPVPAFKTVSSVGVVDTLISYKALDRLIRQDITFAVIGNQAPTPGFSLDLSDKLSLKLTGLIPTKRKIVTVDLTASRADATIPLFTEGRFNGQIGAGVNFHVIPNGTVKPLTYRLFRFLNLSDRQKEGVVLGNSYSFRAEDRQLLTELELADGTKYSTDLLDTVAVLACYMKSRQPQSLTDIYTTNQIPSRRLNRLNALYTRVCNGGNSKRCNRIREQIAAEQPPYKPALDAVIANIPVEPLADVQRTITGSRANLFLKLAKTYFDVPTSATTVAAVATAIGNLDRWEGDKLYTALVKACDSYRNKAQLKQSAEIVRSQPLWLRKQINWFTFSAKPVLTTFSSFLNNPDSARVDVSTLSFFELNVPVWYQFYDIRQRGGNLWRFGAELVLGNNRKLFKDTQYLTRDTLITYPNDLVITQEQKEGILDDGTDRANKHYVNYYAEFYRLPRRNFVPGYALRLGYVRDAIFGKDTDRKVKVEVSGILNILNQEKDKAAFTLQPYVSVVDPFKEVKTGESGQIKTFGEKLNVGIRLGLPIRGQLGVGRR